MSGLSSDQIKEAPPRPPCDLLHPATARPHCAQQ
eukprot:gene56098-8140_t